MNTMANHLQGLYNLDIDKFVGDFDSFGYQWLTLYGLMTPNGAIEVLNIGLANGLLPKSSLVQVMAWPSHDLNQSWLWH